MKIKAGIESEEIYNERGLLHGAQWGEWVLVVVWGGGPRALALSDVCPLKLRLSYKAPHSPGSQRRICIPKKLADTARQFVMGR